MSDLSKMTPNAETIAALEEAEALRRRLPEGSKRATLYLERHPDGLWFVYSDELRGLLLTHRDLGTILSAVPEAGKSLLQAMEEWHAKTPYTEEKQLKQMQIYRDFFGDHIQRS